MKSITLFFCFVTFMSLGCKKDKECNPTCGPLQQCDDGVCSCPNGQYLLGNSCIDKCSDCFEGSFDCGCTDKYVINISEKSGNLITLNYVIPGTIGIVNNYPNITYINSTKFKFLVERICNFGDRTSTNIEFTVDKSEPSKLKVQARYHILPSNETLGTCETVFTQ